MDALKLLRLCMNVVVVVGGVLFLALVLFGPPRLDASAVRALQRQGAGIVSAIHAFRTTQGRLPRSLPEAGAEAGAGRFGSWKYEVVEKGEEFLLTVGDYGRNGAVLHWKDADGTWHEDR